MFHLNTTVFLKINYSYVFQLAKGAIIRLNMKKIKEKICSCN